MPKRQTCRITCEVPSQLRKEPSNGSEREREGGERIYADINEQLVDWEPHCPDREGDFGGIGSPSDLNAECVVKTRT